MHKSVNSRTNLKRVWVGEGESCVLEKNMQMYVTTETFIIYFVSFMKLSSLSFQYGTTNFLNVLKK